jgi:branched-chain amino acid aminotransferase
MEIKGKYVCYNDSILDKANAEKSIDFTIFDIYEVIRIIHGIPVFLNEHLSRLENSVKKVRDNYAADSQMIITSALNFIKKSRTHTGNIVLLFSSVTFDYVIHFIPHRYPDKTDYQTGVVAKTCGAERSFPNIKQVVVNNAVKKTISSMMNEKHIYEILLVNSKGYITEGSKSNLFFVKKNKLYTAREETVLKGITRDKIIYCCQVLNIPVIETDIPLNDISFYDATFISGTSPKVLPLKQINEYFFPPHHKVIESIHKEYDQLIRMEIAQSKNM